MLPDDAQSIEAGRKLFAGSWEFIHATADVASLPEATLPEVCLTGRSNVGKSSLINALTGRHALARISNTPGRTRELVFFEISRQLRIVDMPGYGFATVARDVRESWEYLVQAFVRGRVTLRRALVLIDGRHGPKSPDEAMIALLDQAGVPHQVVLTKADKPKRAALNEVVERTKQLLIHHPSAHPEVAITSAHSGLGIDGLRAAIALLSAPSQQELGRTPAKE